MMVQLNHSVQSTCKIIVDVVYELWLKNPEWIPCSTYLITKMIIKHSAAILSVSSNVYTDINII
jgi:hypothetical protein